EDNVVTSLVAVHPLRKECYELPPLPSSPDLTGRESCGLGFDDSANVTPLKFQQRNGIPLWGATS
ncbi:hypothetical protein Tco_1374096, partial [Tanacetum coccineum]